MKLPKGWERKEMSALGSIQAGRQRSPHHVKGTLRPYLRVANVQDGWIDFSDVKQMAFTDKEAEIYELARGDVLLSEGQSLELVGRPAIYQGDLPCCCFQNTLVRLRPAGHHKLFVFYACQHLFIKGAFQRIAKKTTSIAHLGVSRFAELQVAVPPSGEQRKIAAILSTWDKALEKLDALIEAQERRKKDLMQQLLTGKKRLKGFVKPWKSTRLGDLLEPANRYIEWDEARIVRLAGVRRNNGGLFFRNELPASQIKVKTAKLIRSGDFLISRRQITYGGMAVVPAAYDGFEVNDEYEVLVPTEPGKLDIHYFGYLAHSPRLKHLAYLASNGVFAERLRMNFDLSSFLDSCVVLPTQIEEQRQIAALLDTADQQLALLRTQRNALDQQKRGLMQRLLTGKLRVK